MISKIHYLKILLSLSFVFVVAVSYAQYVVTGGSGSPMKASQSSGDSAELREIKGHT